MIFPEKILPYHTKILQVNLSLKSDFRENKRKFSCDMNQKAHLLLFGFCAEKPK